MLTVEISLDEAIGTVRQRMRKNCSMPSIDRMLAFQGLGYDRTCPAPQQVILTEALPGCITHTLHLTPHKYSKYPYNTDYGEPK